jgi:hypothetical protein
MVYPDDEGDYNWSTLHNTSTALIKTKKYLCHRFSCLSCPAYMDDDEECSLEVANDIMPY